MITDSELLRYCSVPVLNRARSIAFARAERLSGLSYERVADPKTSRPDAIVRLAGRVQTHAGEPGSCEVVASLDERRGELCQPLCSCTAPHGRVLGICEHVAALVLRYNRAPGAFAGFRQRRFDGTAQALSDFMRAADARRAEREAQRARALAGEGAGPSEPPAGSVSLELTLTQSFDVWGARFRVVGPEGAYVLKDVEAFVDDMRAGARVTYGKKLAFTHTLTALDPCARGAYEVLARIFPAQDAWGEAAMAYGSGRGRRGRGPAGRDVALSEEEACDLLDAYRDAPFFFLDENEPGGEPRPARIVEGDPAPGVVVERYEDEGCAGYLLKLAGEPLRFLARGDETYARVGAAFHRCSSELAAARELVELLAGRRAGDGGLYVDDADQALFCRTVLPLLGASVASAVPPELEAARPVPCRLSFFLDRATGMLTCDAAASYGAACVAVAGAAHALPSAEAQGGATLGTPEPVGQPAGVAGVPGPADASAQGASAPSTAPAQAAPAPVVRDEAAEALARALVARYLGVAEPGAQGRLTTKDVDGVGRLLTEGLPALREVGEVYTTPAFDALVAGRAPRVRVGLSVRSGLVELSAIAEEVPRGEVAAVLASYRRKRRFHRLKDGTFLDLANADLDELDRVAAELSLTSAQLNAGSVELEGYHAFRLEGLVADADKDESFASYLEGVRAVDPQRYEVPAQVASVLRPYQREGYRWLRACAEKGFGGILADEMGLGKSVQLISFLLATRDEAAQVGPSLVVCPASLVYNWKAEFERFAPQMSVGVVAGTPEERARVRGRAAWAGTGGASRAGAYEVLVTSYDLLRRDADAYEGGRFFCQVLDEAQYIKNHATKIAQAVRQVGARHRFALTGTPIENRLSELWSIFDFLMPGFLGSYRRFQERFEQPVLDGDHEASGALQALVAPFVLRRLKADVLRDLPDKLDNVVYVQLEGEQRRLYAAQEQLLRSNLGARDDASLGREKLQVLAELMRLRQLCCDPHLVYEDVACASAKLDAIAELVEGCRDSGQKVLVFSQFTSFLDLIAQRLGKEGVAFYTITGATPKKRRLELVNAFNADETPAFLISLKAGNTGLNLTGASAVIHADPWWNAAAQDQATDRAHRIGQTRAVNVYQVVAKDTVEERILHLQQAKSDLADRFIAGAAEGAGGIAGLTRDDLLALLG